MGCQCLVIQLSYGGLLYQSCLNNSTIKSGQTPSKPYIVLICVALWTFWYHINKCKTFPDSFVLFWNEGSLLWLLLSVYWQFWAILLWRNTLFLWDSKIFETHLPLWSKKVWRRHLNNPKINKKIHQRKKMKTHSIFPPQSNAALLDSTSKCAKCVRGAI